MNAASPTTRYLVDRIRQMKSDPAVRMFNPRQAIFAGHAPTPHESTLAYQLFDVNSQREFSDLSEEEIDLAAIFKSKRTPQFKIPAQLKKSKTFAALDTQADELLAVPIVLLSPPLGYVLTTNRDEEFSKNLFLQRFHQFSELAKDGFRHYLAEEFSEDKLRQYLSADQLTQAFITHLAQWLQPSALTVNGVAQDIALPHTYFLKHRDWVGSYDFSVELNTATQSYSCVFQLSTFEYYFNKTTQLHDLSEDVTFPCRCNRLRACIQTVFKRILSAWTAVRKHPHTIIAQINSMIDQLTAVRNLYYPTESHAVQPEAKIRSHAANCCYRENGIWKIYFQGERMAKPKSEQGMLSISYLLTHPERQIELEELYYFLQRQGEIRGEKGKGDLFDPQTVLQQSSEDEVTLVGLLEELEEVKKLEAKIAGFDPEKQITFYQYYVDLIKNLNQFKSERRKRIGLMEKLNAKLNDLYLKNGLERDFLSPVAKVTRISTRNQDTKNTGDSIKRGIRETIRQYKTVNEAFHDFLTDTIVFKIKSGFRPFGYQPGLTRDKSLRDLFNWQTKVE